MLINVRNLADLGKDAYSNVNEEFTFNENITIDYGDTLIPCDLGITGKVCRADYDYILDCKVKAVLKLNCDLCLSLFETELNFTMNEVFSEKADFDNEFWELSNKIIDLKPAVIANIVLNMPMQIHCSNECKGLCLKCGHNMNDGDCGCDTSNINPQFEELLTLFKDD